jgi:ethanolamine utilization microcompartment shell protein EutL
MESITMAAKYDVTALLAPNSHQSFSVSLIRAAPADCRSALTAAKQSSWRE